MIVVNFFAGPGAGKSTLAAGVFARLKAEGVLCELVTEFAKELVWDDSLATLRDQALLLATQHHRLWRLREQVDVAITDSPTLLALTYGVKETPTFKNFARELFGNYENVNYYVDRRTPFKKHGRVQDDDEEEEEEARLLDREVHVTLHEESVGHLHVPGLPGTIDEVVQRVRSELRERRLVVQ